MTKKRSKKSRRRRANADASGGTVDGGGAVQNQCEKCNCQELDNLVGNLSMEQRCKHGAPELSLLTLRNFMRDFEREHLDKLVADKPKRSAVSYYFLHFGYMADPFIGGDMNSLNFRKSDIDELYCQFISLGTDYLLKSMSAEGGLADDYRSLSRSLAMIAKYISDYPGPGGNQRFQSYMGVFNPDRGITKDLLSLGRDRREADRFLSSRNQCSCIPEFLTCHHGFPDPPKDDPIYTFWQEYESAAIDSAGGNFMDIADRLQAKGLSHLWDNEEKVEKVVSCLVSMGTDLVLGGQIQIAKVNAISIMCLELTGHLSVTMQPEIQHDLVYRGRYLAAQALIPKFVMDIMGDPERQVTKFFLSRSSCSCLKEK